jgi:DNA-binding LytR/AlgR family response regulator
MEQTPFIELPTRLGSEFINPSDVIAIQANDKEVILTLENKVYKEVRLPFSKAVTLFDEPHFFTCHRSHLINILKTKQYYKKEGKIILAGDIGYFGDTDPHFGDIDPLRF